MALGIIGRGYWGNAYKNTLEGLNIPHWQAGRDWEGKEADGLIIACSSEAHYSVARKALERGIPVIVEKPVTLNAKEAWALVGLGGIAFDAHIRLYDPVWREFKKALPEVKEVSAVAGGTNATNPDHLWNWTPHLVAMCLDLGVKEAHFDIRPEKTPLEFNVSGWQYANESGWWRGNPTPLAVLVAEFLEAIRKGIPDNNRLVMGARAVEITERIRKQTTGRFNGLCHLGV